MTSEQPEKYAYCENENNQNATFLMKIPNVSGLNSNCGDGFYTNQNWNYRFILKFLKELLYVTENLPLVTKNKRHVIILFASNNV